MGTPPVPGSISSHFEHPHSAAMGGHCRKSEQLLESELGFLDESFPQALIPLSLAQLLRTPQPSKAQSSPKASGIYERRNLPPLWVFTSPVLQHSGQLWARWHSWSSQPDPLPKAVSALGNTTAECWGAFPLGQGKGSSCSSMTWLWCHGCFRCFSLSVSGLLEQRFGCNSVIRVSCLHPTRFCWQGHAPGRDTQSGWVNSNGCQQGRLTAEVKRLSAELCWMISVQPEPQTLPYKPRWAQEEAQPSLFWRCTISSQIRTWFREISFEIKCSTASEIHVKTGKVLGG